MNNVTVSIAAIEALGVNPWCTKEATPTKALALVKACLVEGKNWSEACSTAGIKYSRGWLIVRWTELMLTNPEAIVLYEAHADKATDLYRLSQVAQGLRASSLSWGEIAVRTGAPESKVRQAFNEYSGTRAEGTRIGHGGRFVADRPDLYVENRKREGALIPHIPQEGIKFAPSSVKVEALLNYIAPDAPKVTAKRKAAVKKANA